MKMFLCTALCATVLVFAADFACADPGKDESGKGQWRGSSGRQGDNEPRRYRQTQGTTRSSAASWRVPGLASRSTGWPPGASLQMLRNPGDFDTYGQAT